MSSKPFSACWAFRGPSSSSCTIPAGEVRTITVGGTTAGYCWVELREHVLHIHALFVLPERRGRGVGRAALLGLEREYARRVAGFELGVKETNSIARRLYEQCGFVVDGAVPKLGYLIMRKSVSGDPASGGHGRVAEERSHGAER